MGILFQDYLNENWNISDFRYAVGMDLSTVSTGIALYDIQERTLLDFQIIDYKKEDKIFVQMNEIESVLTEWRLKYNIKEDNCLFAKEKQPIQYGMKTTVNTLISIAKLHGLVENYFYGLEMCLLDIAVPTIRKIVVGNSKAEKEVVYNFIIQNFPQIKGIKGEKDVADAIAVCLSVKDSLIKDMQEEIKELKKSIKQYKSVIKQTQIIEQITKIKGKINAN